MVNYCRESVEKKHLTKQKKKPKEDHGVLFALVKLLTKEVQYV